jgi:hypothetical protein
MSSSLSPNSVSASSSPSPTPALLNAVKLALVRAVAAIGLALLPGSCLLPAQTPPQSDPIDSLTVLVYNFVEVPPATLDSAQRHAEKILGGAGAKITWIACPIDSASSVPDLCRDGWSMQRPGLRLIAGENKYQTAQFGYTAIPNLSTIYYQRVVNRAHRDNVDSSVSILLGCVIAHELGHLLLRQPGHSATGIMQPSWGPAQMREALTGNLLFTKSEAVRIQSQARILASLPSKSPQTTTP